MDAGLIINDILVWIESNLDGKMSIDIVSQKAGYSKWHLQRMFSSVTGQKLGNYFRERQLTRQVSGLPGGIQVCVVYGAFCWLVLVLS